MKTSFHPEADLYGNIKLPPNPQICFMDTVEPGEEEALQQIQWV